MFRFDTESFCATKERPNVYEQTQPASIHRTTRETSCRYLGDAWRNGHFFRPIGCFFAADGHYLHRRRSVHGEACFDVRGKGLRN
jgi:hypothetical protein